MIDNSTIILPRSRRRLLPHHVATGFARTLLNGWVLFAYVFLLAPLVVLVGASFDGAENYAFVNFPPENPTIKWFFEIPERYFESIGVSIVLAATTAVLSVLFGVPAAFGLARSVLPGRPMVSAIFRAPLQIPSVVIGISFLHLYYAMGSAIGINPAGSYAGLAIGHFFHSMPYVIGTTVAVLQRFDVTLEEAAISLGASRWRAFRRVTVPVILPGVYTGALYSFMVSFGDIPISIFLTTPQFTTFPVEIFLDMDQGLEPPMLAASALVIVFSLGVMLLVQKAVGLEQILRSTYVRN
jgi:putative spermidine/putrescine transport system permease protein